MRKIKTLNTMEYRIIRGGSCDCWCYKPKKTYAGPISSSDNFDNNGPTPLFNIVLSAFTSDMIDENLDDSYAFEEIGTPKGVKKDKQECENSCCIGCMPFCMW